MKFISLLISFLSLYFSSIGFGVSIQPKQSLENDSITAIMISRNFPWMTNEGKLLSYEQENASLFFKGDLILYKIPYVHKIYKLSDSAIYEVDKVEERIKYFICQRGDSLGYFTDTSLNMHFLEYPVDSVLAQLWPTQPFLEPLLENFHYARIDSLNFRKDDIFSTTYFFQNKTDSLQKGTFTLEFCPYFPTVDYSICQRLDTIKEMKLINARVYNEARYVRKYNVTIDAVDDYQRLTLFKDFNLSEITPFFEVIQRRNQKNN